MFKINLILILILSFLIVYKSVIIYFLGNEYIIYVLVFLYILFYLTILFLLLKISRNILWLVPFILSGFISFMIMAYLNTLYIGIIGFLTTFLYLAFWAFIFSSINDAGRTKLFISYIKFHMLMAIGVTLLAVYQFFVDPTIFGIITHSVYADADLLDVQVTRRATSVFGSPQNLAIYMGIVSALVFFIDYKKLTKFSLLIIFMIGGILSGSRAFVYFIFLFAFIQVILNFKERKKKFSEPVIILIIFFLLIACFQNLNQETADRIMVLFRTGGSFEIWTKYIYHNSVFELLFGRGLGVTERLVGVLTGNWMPETESFILKIYYEMGIIGLISLLIIYLKSMYNAITGKCPYDKVIFSFLLSFISNLIATPSFGGLTMSFIVWPIILFPLFTNKAALNYKGAKHN